MRAHVLAIQESALALGFHTPTYSVQNTTGVESHGAAIRMLHESSRMFLQIIAASSGSMMQSYQLLVSSTVDLKEIIVSSNGRPSYKSPAGVRTQYKTGISLPALVEFQEQSLSRMKGDLASIDSFEVVGRVMDFISAQFFTDKIKRGIYLPVEES